jgi:hypothetical protein
LVIDFKTRRRPSSLLLASVRRLRPSHAVAPAAAGLLTWNVRTDGELHRLNSRPG